MLNPKTITIDQCVDHLNSVARSWGFAELPAKVRSNPANLPKLRQMVAKAIREGAKLGGGQ